MKTVRMVLLGCVLMVFGANLTQADMRQSTTEGSTGCPPLYTFTGEASDDVLGWSVSGAGDVNNDGYNDVLIAAPRSDESGRGVQTGRVYVFSGKDGSTLYVLIGEASNDAFGLPVSGAGDVNADGYADVIVGARYHDAEGSDAGRAYVFLGGPGPHPVTVTAENADMLLTGNHAGDRFGGKVSGAGDVNSDGYADVVVGAPQDYQDGNGAGRAYLFLGGSGPFPMTLPAANADITFTGEAAGDGLAVPAGAGDINDDGYDDVIVGAWHAKTGGADLGHAYVFLGAPVESPKTVSAVDADLIFVGESVGDLFGGAVSGVGDINQDGFSDMAVGAPYNDAGGTDAGRVYVFLGGPGPFPPLILAGNAYLTLTGEAPSDPSWFGSSVSGAGDVNCDSFADIIVGASQTGGWTSSTVPGRAHVFFGGPESSPREVHASNSDMTYWSESPGDAFGCSVSGVGDLNNDGCDDLIVGAWLNSETAYRTGRAYVYSCEREITTVTLDIKPGDCPNYVNLRDKDHDDDDDVIIPGQPDDAGESAGMLKRNRKKFKKLKAAILGDVDFDASQIDPNTVMLEGVPAMKWELEDETTPPQSLIDCACSEDEEDGFIDLELKFDRNKVLDALGSVNAGEIVRLTITGELYDGTPVTGSDCLWIIGDEDDDHDSPPASSALALSNSPNPFNPATTIQFDLPKASNYIMTIYNIMGQVVEQHSDYSEAGVVQFEWNASDKASGVYFYRLQAGDLVETKKMVLLK